MRKVRAEAAFTRNSQTVPNRNAGEYGDEPNDVNRYSACACVRNTRCASMGISPEPGVKRL